MQINKFFKEHESKQTDWCYQQQMIIILASCSKNQVQNASRATGWMLSKKASSSKKTSGWPWFFVEEETLQWVKYRMMMYINATQQHVQSFIWMKLRLLIYVPGVFRLVKNVFPPVKKV
jgi:hypothetical protein